MKELGKMKTKKQVQAWLKIKLNNLAWAIGKNFSTSSSGLKRARTRLKGILDQLDEYLKEGLK